MRAIGIDVSWHEGAFYPTVKEWDFAYFKVSEGVLNYLEASGDTGKFTRAIASTIGEIEVRGAYHYMRRNDQYHWQRQADTYLRAVEQVEGEYKTELHFDVLDIERTNNTVWRGISLGFTYPQAFGSAVYEWCKYVKERRGKPLLLYMDQYSWVECFTWNNYTFQRDYPLILAQYPLKQWSDALHAKAQAEQPELPADASNWLMWQYSDQMPADGVTDSQAIDVNVFNGNVADLCNYFGITAEPPPVEPPADDLEQVRRRANKALVLAQGCIVSIEGIKEDIEAIANDLNAHKNAPCPDFSTISAQLEQTSEQIGDITNRVSALEAKLEPPAGTVTIIVDGGENGKQVALIDSGKVNEAGRIVLVAPPVDSTRYVYKTGERVLVYEPIPVDGGQAYEIYDHPGYYLPK